MRALILSDIHSNIEALDAVLDAVPRDAYDQLLVLGDLVGYGASPNEVIDRIYDLEPDVLIRGNHDKVASGVEPPRQFNQAAAEAATWTLSTLTDANRERVATLPAGPASVDETVEVCHGTPFDEDVYIFDEDDARKALASASRRVCFFGHTHLPVAFSPADNRLDVVIPELCATEPDGDHARRASSLSDQPRLGGTAARRRPASGLRHVRRERGTGGSFAAWAYRVDIAQEKISAAQLPVSLARRLGVGR